MCRFRCINHGPKVEELSRLTIYQLWFWNPVRAFGLHDLLYTRYKTVTHTMITTMCNNFHLPVGEMSIRLDDVATLLHILM